MKYQCGALLAASVCGFILLPVSGNAVIPQAVTKNFHGAPRSAAISEVKFVEYGGLLLCSALTGQQHVVASAAGGDAKERYSMVADVHVTQPVAWVPAATVQALAAPTASLQTQGAAIVDFCQELRGTGTMRITRTNAGTTESLVVTVYPDSVPDLQINGRAMPVPLSSPDVPVITAFTRDVAADKPAANSVAHDVTAVDLYQHLARFFEKTLLYPKKQLDMKYTMPLSSTYTAHLSLIGGESSVIENEDILAGSAGHNTNVGHALRCTAHMLACGSSALKQPKLSVKFTSGDRELVSILVGGK